MDYTLSYTATHGTIEGVTPQTVDSGTDGAQVMAVPETGYHFEYWSDGVITATRTDTYVERDHTVTAVCSIDLFPLTYTTDGGGSIDGEDLQTVSYGGDGTPVTASPSDGYHFLSWSDGATAAARTDRDVTLAVNVTAGFANDSVTSPITGTVGGNISVDDFHEQLKGLAKMGSIRHGNLGVSAKGSDFICGAAYNSYIEASAGLHTASLLVGGFRSDMQASFSALTQGMYLGVMAAMDRMLSGMPDVVIPLKLDPLSVVAAVNIPAEFQDTIMRMLPDSLLSSLTRLVNVLGTDTAALAHLVDDPEMFRSEFKDIAAAVDDSLAYPEQLGTLLTANAKALGDSALRGELNGIQLMVVNCVSNYLDFLKVMDIPGIIGKLRKAEQCLMKNYGRPRQHFFYPGTSMLMSERFSEIFMLGYNGKVRFSNITSDRAKISMMKRIVDKRNILNLYDQG
jgi:hypothetical protein